MTIKTTVFPSTCRSLRVTHFCLDVISFSTNKFGRSLFAHCSQYNYMKTDEVTSRHADQFSRGISREELGAEMRQVCALHRRILFAYHVSYASKSIYKDFCDRDGIIFAYTAISCRKDLQSAGKLRGVLFKQISRNVS